MGTRNANDAIGESKNDVQSNQFITSGKLDEYRQNSKGMTPIDANQSNKSAEQYLPKMSLFDDPKPPTDSMVPKVGSIAPGEQPPLFKSPPNDGGKVSVVGIASKFDSLPGDKVDQINPGDKIDPRELIGSVADPGAGDKVGFGAGSGSLTGSGELNPPGAKSGETLPPWSEGTPIPQDNGPIENVSGISGVETNL